MPTRCQFLTCSFLYIRTVWESSILNVYLTKQFNPPPPSPSPVPTNLPPLSTLYNNQHFNVPLDLSNSHVYSTFYPSHLPLNYYNQHFKVLLQLSNSHVYYYQQFKVPIKLSNFTRFFYIKLKCNSWYTCYSNKTNGIF